jgi:GH24 family phage-related lysozyme (muramidase)
MKISDAGLDLIRDCEGFKSHLYNCPANDASIGYGHLVHHGPVCGAASEAPFANGITEAGATTLLLSDVASAEEDVTLLVTVPMTQGQFDALVDFVYNEGVGHFETSTLLKKLNAGEHAIVPSLLRQWVYGGGRKLTGLVYRREAEARMFAG